MNGKKRTMMLIIIDIILINLALITSLYLRFEGNVPHEFWISYRNLALAFTAVRIICFYFFGLYHRIWQYASTGELLAIIYSISVGTIINVTIGYITHITLPRSIYALSWMLMLILIGGSRLIWRLVRENMTQRSGPGNKPVLIVGAGDAGAMVARELRNYNAHDYEPVGFIDDAEGKQGQQLLGLPVLGTRYDLQKIIQKHDVQEVIIAMPSASGQVIRETVAICEHTGVKLKILPSVYSLIDGKATVSQIREVQLEDLLGREPVSVDLKEIASYLKDRVVLITGAGGSIGSELCRQVSRFHPKELILLGHDENPIFEIEMELQQVNRSTVLKSIIADVKDREKIFRIFERCGPEVVFHAAAHKHVPMMEINPDEALKNNILGTRNVAEAADKVGTKVFILISTDKAVNPTNVMGATKRVAELIIQRLNETSETKFAAVRFGNVLGSRGSAVPVFKEQIARGGPVTVTHPDMKRYFMTIPEAVQLVIQAGAMATGGEIFILDMGEPVKIIDLVRDLIRLSGLEPDKDIQIVFTGIRPGEKLYEELLSADEGTTTTKHKRIYVARPNGIDPLAMEALVTRVSRKGFSESPEEIFEMLKRVLPEYHKPEISRVQQVG
ncbi:MAG: polysaccharide biosynthesis protein [Bacillota bacterium]